MHAEEPLSVRVREQTAAVHADAERSPLMADLAAGRLSRGQYAALLAQLQHVYAALDSGSHALRRDPRVGRLLDPRLDRTAAIAADLAVLGSAAMSPTTATREYVERITSVSTTWPVGFVAHHYTRYLGDLSGGMVIARALETSLGLTTEAGLAFYRFDLPSIPAFKRDYRARLDALDLDGEEAEAFFEETRRAFAGNSALFASLLTVA